jgi:hypothetical protein
MLQTFDRGAVYRAFIIDCLRSVYPVHVLLAMDASTLANEIARGDAALFSGRNPERRAISALFRGCRHLPPVSSVRQTLLAQHDSPDSYWARRRSRLADTAPEDEFGDVAAARDELPDPDEHWDHVETTAEMNTL